MSLPSQNFFRRRLEWIMAILITATIVCLHFYFLFHVGGFWRDEVNLINLSRCHSLSGLSKDSFPVLMPLLVKSWTAIGFGRSDLCLRVLGTLIGIGIVAAFWTIAWKSKKPPLFGLVLFCLNANAICYGDSMRAFGSGCLLIVLAAAAVLAILEKPSWWRAGILALMTILSVQIIYTNAALVAAICFGAWSVCWRRKDFPTAIKIFPAAFLSAASLLPYWKNLFGLLLADDPLRVGFSPAIAFENLDSLLGYPLPQYAIAWWILAVIVTASGAVTLLCLRQTKSNTSAEKTRMQDFTLFAAVTLLAAFAAFMSALWLSERRTEIWYFLPLACLCALCFDLGLRQFFDKRWIRAFLFFAIVVTAVAEITSARENLKMRFTNVDVLAKQLNKQAGLENFVVVTPWFCGISFERYCNPRMKWQTSPPLSDHSVHRYDLLVKEMKMTNPLEPVIDQISRNTSIWKSRLDSFIHGRRRDEHSKRQQFPAEAFAASAIKKIRVGRSALL